MNALGIMFLAALTTLPQATVSDAALGPDGVLTHTVVSSYQAGRTEIKVLLPDRREFERLNQGCYWSLPLS